MRRNELEKWALEFFERHSSRCCDDTGDREKLAHALAREVPGILVDDSYLGEMDEMLSLHATFLQAQNEAAQIKLNEDKRPDGKDKVEHIVETTRTEELRAEIADLQIAIEERVELRCPQCGTAPPATLCKMDCTERKYRG